jgi:hypothetical protein
LRREARDQRGRQQDVRLLTAEPLYWIAAHPRIPLIFATAGQMG